MNDPISDLLTRIRNAVRARHARTDVPHSRLKESIAGILKEEGYLADVSTLEKEGFKVLRLKLRYDSDGRPFVTGLERVSRPGKRVYAGHDAIPRVMGGIGLTIMSTPRGMMSGSRAKKAGIGGEIVCAVW
jgi:small subunit ribosomal protein S8